LERPVPDLRGVAAPPEVLELVRRLLAKRREDRPQSAAEVAQELRRGAGRDPGAGPATGPATGGRDKVSRARAALALGLCGLALGAGVWWYVRPRAPE